jgi:hypothetical protein
LIQRGQKAGLAFDLALLFLSADRADAVSFMLRS